jgi:hypothetical protein
MDSLSIGTTRHRNSVIELIVSGVLTIDSAASLRGSVHKCAAEMPAGIVLDLNGISQVERLALLAIPTLQRYCADLAPPIALVVHAGPDCLAADALRSHLQATVTVFADLHTAAGYAIAAARPWPAARLQLRRRPSTMAQVHRFVHRKCRDWLIPWVAHRAELVADELVANALAYSPGMAVLAISLNDSQLRISVHDTSSRLPHARLSPVPSPERGLGLVDLVSTRWGTFLVQPGKTVWADVSLNLD